MRKRNANLTLKECKLSPEKHALPKIKAHEKAKSVHDQSSRKKKEEVFGAPRANEEDKAEAASEEEKKAVKEIGDDADDERAKAIEDGSVSSGLDLWVSHEDGSLYKHSTCNIHSLTHLPKDPNCSVCSRAEMFFRPC